MRRCLLLCAFAFALLAPGAASACVYEATTRVQSWSSVGPVHVTQAQERRWFVQGRRIAADEALAEGTDPALLLGQLLVPNIRPVPIEHSDCGPTNEIDFGAGEERFSDWLAGTYLAGHAELDASVIRVLASGGETLGRACNAEFRDRFAAYLRRRLDPGQLRASYLFLASRSDHPGRPVTRLVRFEGDQRRPPVRWISRFNDDIERWERRTAVGRAMKQALDDFWRENGPPLGDNASVCPAAVARWPAIQAQILADLERQYAEVRRLRPPAP